MATLLPGDILAAMNGAASYRQQRLELPTATVGIRQFEWSEPIDDLVVPDGGRHYVDMCLTPRPAQARASYAHCFAPTESELLGRVIFLPAGVPVRLRAAMGRTWSFQCTFDADTFDSSVAAWNRERLREAMHVRNASVKAACDRIVAEMSEPGFASSIAIESLCALMAIDLVRHFSSLPKTLCGGLPAWRLRRIEERVQAEGAAPTLSELAALCGMSPRHLTRAFRQQTGRTLTNLVTEVRIARAKTLLAGDNLSLKQISVSLGFAQLSNFSTAFLRATGERPSTYRARIQSERRLAARSPSNSGTGAG